jgi:hypothetical protein
VYLDEDVLGAVGAGLRRRGFEVVTTVEVGRSGTSDERQLEFAAAEGRVLVTFNRGDFARLHAGYLRQGRAHAGIVVSRQAEAGAVVRALAKLLGAKDTSELDNTLFWLAISE